MCVGGWEGNERGKPGARRADLGGAMDPTRLAVGFCIAELYSMVFIMRMTQMLFSPGMC